MGLAGAIHSPVNFVYIVNLKLPRGLLTLEEAAQACIISKKQEMSLKTAVRLKKYIAR